MEKINIAEILKRDTSNVKVTEINKPNYKLMAQAFINMKKESIK